MVKIRIPATSANIGSGFDALGLALNLYNYVYMAEADRTEITAHDGAAIPTGEDNLVFTSAKHLFELCGKRFHGLRIEQISNIPFARGLGSSSACVIGGLVGANELMGVPLSKDEIIDAAAQIEGHPDNTTPALLGGLITAVIDSGHVYHVKQQIQPELKFAAIIPDFELRTSVARGLLPKTVSHDDARFNLGRAALMAVSLYSGKYENLRVASADSLHQQYRLPMIPRADEVITMCCANGAYAAYISGAGTSILSIFNDAVLDFEQKTRDSLDDMGLGQWGLHILSIDNNGAMVMRD